MIVLDPLPNNALSVIRQINRLNSTILDKMILQMRGEGLSDSSINSYTRTLKCFLSWCNEEGYTNANLKIYKAAERGNSPQEANFSGMTAQVTPPWSV